MQAVQILYESALAGSHGADQMLSDLADRLLKAAGKYAQAREAGADAAPKPRGKCGKVK